MLELLRSKTGRLAISGHRGASGYAPENTMPAFEKALQTGADIVEFDVHLSRDKKCIVMHDELLDRTTNGHGVIWEHDWSELRQLDAGSWFDRRNEARAISTATELQPLPIATEHFAGARIPLLAEVLEWARSVNMPVSVEIKAPWPFYYGPNVYPDLAARVVAEVEQYGNPAATVIHSFDHRAVQQCKKLNPDISTLVSFSGAVLVDPLGPVRAAGANGMAISSLWVTRELIDAAHAEDINLFGWGPGDDPYNQATDLCRLVEMGVDYVSGGYPDLLRKVVENCFVEL